MRLILLFCFVVFGCYGQDSIQKKDYKLTRKAFLLRYAQGDTLLVKAINFYFDKRIDARNKLVALPVGVVVTSGSLLLYDKAKTNQDKSLTGFGVIFGVAATVISIPLTIKGLRILRKYNKRQLYMGILQVKAGAMSSTDFLNKILIQDVRE
jgi:hypothetical protein